MKQITILFALVFVVSQATFAQWTDSGAYMRTDDNVNIGVSSNAYPLYVRKNDSGWQGRFTNRGGTGADIYLAHGAGYGMHIRGRTTDSKYTLQLYNANTQTNIFYNNGNVGLGLVGRVGIGTNSPSKKLHVKTGTGNGEAEAIEFESAHTLGPRMRFNATGAGGRLWDMGASANGATGEGGGGKFFVRDGTSGNTRFIIDAQGDVGIGTLNPTYKLAVNGTIRAKEVRVETGWSDYVFESTYRVPTLEEEEAHIKEKGHLLGFQSAEEMKGEAELAKVTTQQQAKIEEMMLHLIELNKKIEKLDQENQDLKAVIQKGK